MSRTPKNSTPILIDQTANVVRHVVRLLLYLAVVEKELVLVEQTANDPHHEAIRRTVASGR